MLYPGCFTALYTCLLNILDTKTVVALKSDEHLDELVSKMTMSN